MHVHTHTHHMYTQTHTHIHVHTHTHTHTHTHYAIKLDNFVRCLCSCPFTSFLASTWSLSVPTDNLPEPTSTMDGNLRKVVEYYVNAEGKVVKVSDTLCTHASRHRHRNRPLNIVLDGIISYSLASVYQMVVICLPSYTG